MLKRMMNVFMLAIAALSLSILIFADRNGIVGSMGFLVAGLIIVVGLNYIIFGKVTVWHKTEKEN